MSKTKMILFTALGLATYIFVGFTLPLFDVGRNYNDKMDTLPRNRKFLWV